MMSGELDGYLQNTTEKVHMDRSNSNKGSSPPKFLERLYKILEFYRKKKEDLNTVTSKVCHTGPVSESI